MSKIAPRGIQATLFDYFQDTEYFTIQEANELVLEHQKRDVNTESIRARIYEGVDKGLFERVGKGLYMVTRDNEDGSQSNCLLINGDGRDLSMFPDNSLDTIITDHPYLLTASLKGGNRNFADYELFQYTEEDFQEKHRVLKPGHFLVEFLPEENADNYQYLYQVKEMARKAGMEYYAKVGWQKGDFRANTGRKSKNVEDICFFSKGRARDLRPDAKKDKQYASTHETVEFKEHIPGSVTVHYSDMGGLGTSDETKTEPVDVNIRISVLKEDASRARDILDEAWENVVIYSYENSPLDVDNGGKYSLEELYDMPVQEYILKYLEAKNLSFDDTSKGDVKHYMSGAHGMLPCNFNVAPPGKKERIHQAEKPVQLLEEILKYVTLPGETALDQFAGSGVLGVAAMNTGRNSILIEKDESTFQKLTERLQLLGNMHALTPAAQSLISVGSDALVAQDASQRTGDRDIIYDFVKTHTIEPSLLYEGEKDLRRDNVLTQEQQEAVSDAFSAIEDVDLRSEDLDLSDDARKPSDGISKFSRDFDSPNTLECSSRGDRRFSPLFAKVTIKGKEKSIVEWYQNSKRTADGKKVGKGKAFDHIIDPFTGDKLPASEAPWFYRGLWITYFSNNPDLVEYASQFDKFSNAFSGKGIETRYEEIVQAYAKGDRQRYIDVVKCSDWYKNMASKKKPSLDNRIQSAESRIVDVRTDCLTKPTLHR